MGQLIIVYVFVSILSIIMVNMLSGIFNLGDSINYLEMIISNLIIFLYIIKAYKASLLDQFSKYKMKNNIVVIAAVILMILCDVIFSSLGIGAKTSANQQSVVSVFTDNNFINFFIIITISFVAPIVEEMLFRYHLVSKFNQRDIWLWVMLSSLIFGLMHAGFNLPHLAQYSIHGLVFALAYLKTENIMVPIYAHIINNSLATLAVFIS